MGWTGKTFLITGGTGSFGQGFVSMCVDGDVFNMIRVFSRDEHKQRDLRSRYSTDRVSMYIGDVRDKDRLRRAMAGCQYVVHAAALKQAPVGEIEPQEFIKTNIMGSMNVIEAAADAGVERCLLISTDKAVEPINLYGATKMCAEKMFLQADAMTQHTRYAVVRYGNVAGTAGSIVPVLRALPPGAPTPIHDPEATRFWITLAEANRFVLDSLLSMCGGEVFIPRMRSVRVLDVAEAVRPGAPIITLGARPGDKQHEVLSLTPERYSSDQNDLMTPDEIRRALEPHPIYSA